MPTIPHYLKKYLPDTDLFFGIIHSKEAKSACSLNIWEFSYNSYGFPRLKRLKHADLEGRHHSLSAVAV
jgi:hypothetical protein